MTVDQAWGRCWTEQQQQVQQQQQIFYPVGISPGIRQSYDMRAAVTVNALSRNFLAPHYISTQGYSAPTSTTLVAHPPLQQQQNSFSFGGYTEAHSNGLVSAFANNYIQRRPLPDFIQCEVDPGRNLSYPRNTRQGFVEELHNQSPPVKSESVWNVPTTSPALTSTSLSITSSPRTASDIVEVDFKTEVDTLMKAIQAKAKEYGPETNSPVLSSIPLAPVSSTPAYDQVHSSANSIVGDSSKYMLARDKKSFHAHSKATRGHGTATEAPKRYLCEFAAGDAGDTRKCNQSFNQKTHLMIHERKHTGETPFKCDICDKQFSQRGNLKTHIRRHTGERPYKCQTCGKKFAQKGNVKNHEATHSQNRPFQCRLSDTGKGECGKLFTQLGNLKCHMNRFHKSDLARLTAKFATLDTGDLVNANEKELWEYFAALYKNSNKGIKGRGRNNKVGASQSPMHVVSALRVNTASYPSYNMVTTHGHGMQREGGYEMYGGDERSLSGNGSEGSVGTLYDDAQVDGYEQEQHQHQHNHQHQQHFVERMY